MHFTLKQLSYFVAAAETGSITLASYRMHVTQPAISLAISHLEDIFTLQFCVRNHSQGLSLTNDGRFLLREAQALLIEAEKLEADLKERSGKICGPISIGCLSTIFPLVVPKIIRTIKNSNIALDVDWIDGNQEELIIALNEGTLSMILTYDLDLPKHFNFINLFDINPYVLLPGSHELSRRKSINLIELNDFPLILLDLPYSKKYFLNLFKDSGIVPNVYGLYSDINVIRSLVASGEGYSIANARYKNKASFDGLDISYVELNDNFKPLSYGIAIINNVSLTTTTSFTLSLLENLLKDKELPGTIIEH